MKNISFYIITSLLLFISQQDALFAQTNQIASEDIPVLHDSLKTDDGGFQLSDLPNWKFQPGDDISWADPGFDDSGWHTLQPGLSIREMPDTLWNGYGWWRLTFKADSTFYNKSWLLDLFSMGALEVYLDGELVQSAGVFSTNSAEEIIRHSRRSNILHPTTIHPSDKHVLAVRYSNHNAELLHRIFGTNRPTFSFNLGFAPPEQNVFNFQRQKIRARTSGLVLGVLLLLLLLHLFLYYRFARDKANLYILLLLILLILHATNFFVNIWFEATGVVQLIVVQIFGLALVPVITLLPLTLSELFGVLKYRFWKIYALIGIPLGIIGLQLRSSQSWLFTITFTLFITISLIYCAYLLIEAKKRKVTGIAYVAGGFIVSILSFSMVVFLIDIAIIPHEILILFIILMYTAIPIGLTLYIANNYSNLVVGLEQQVFERTSDLKKSLDDLHATQSQLVQQEKLASLGQLTAGIAHEIKNPLNFVNNFSDVSLEMIDEALEEIQQIGKNQHATETAEILADIKANLTKIHEHGSRADSIVKSMLQHSRGGDGKMEPTDLNALVKEFTNLSFHGMRAGKSAIDVVIELQLDDSIGEVPLIAEDFSRVILNLCNNAFDACAERSRSAIQVKGHTVQGAGDYEPKLMVRTKSENSSVIIEIEDNGPGIPDEIKDKILQPFFTTKKGTQGTGLGLSITNDIVKAHGGSIEITSAPGEGSTFTIQLPK